MNSNTLLVLLKVQHSHNNLILSSGRNSNTRSNSFHQHGRRYSTIPGNNNNLNNCTMMASLGSNNFPTTPTLPNTPVLGNNSIPSVNNNHGNTSRSSSAASNHTLRPGSESSSCSYGYNSPSANLPHSPYQKRNSLSSLSSSVVSSQTVTVPTNASANSGVQGFTGSNYLNQGTYKKALIIILCK